MVMYGPMQLMVIGFPGNKFSGEVIPAFDEARERGLIRLIDYTFVMKDKKGNLMLMKGSDMGPAEVEHLGAVVGGLIGFGAGGVEGAKVGAVVGGKRAKDARGELGFGLSQGDINEIVRSLPNNSSAAFIIIEHLWAKNIKQAVMDSEGSVMIQGMLSPELFLMIGEALAASNEE
jgi:uncharacterized membrane protein